MMVVSCTMFVSKTAEQNRLSRVHDCGVSREGCHEIITTTMNKWGLDAIFCEAADGASLSPEPFSRGSESAGQAVRVYPSGRCP